MSQQKLQEHQKACLRLLSDVMGRNMEFHEMKELCVENKWNIDAIRNIITDFYDSNQTAEQWTSVNRKKSSKSQPQAAANKGDGKRKVHNSTSKSAKDASSAKPLKKRTPVASTSPTATKAESSEKSQHTTNTNKNTTHNNLKEKDGRTAKGPSTRGDKKPGKNSTKDGKNTQKERKPKEVKPVEPPKPTWASIVRAEIPKPAPVPEPKVEAEVQETPVAEEATTVPQKKTREEYVPKEQPLRGEWAKKNGQADPDTAAVVVDHVVVADTSSPEPEEPEHEQTAQGPQVVVPTVITPKIVTAALQPVTQQTTPEEPVVAATTANTVEFTSTPVLEEQPAPVPAPAPVQFDKPQQKPRQQKPAPVAPQPVLQSAVVFKTDASAVGTYTFAAPVPNRNIQPEQEPQQEQSQQQHAPIRSMDDLPMSQRHMNTPQQPPQLVESQLPPHHHQQPHADPHFAHQPPMHPHPHALYDDKVMYDDPYAYGNDESASRRGGHRNGRPHQMQPMYFPMYYYPPHMYPAPVDERQGGNPKRAQGQGQNQPPKAPLSPSSGPQMPPQQQQYNSQYKKGQYAYNNYHSSRPPVPQGGKSVNKQPLPHYGAYPAYPPPSRGMNPGYMYPYSYDHFLPNAPLAHGSMPPHHPAQEEYIPSQHQQQINQDEQRYTFN